MLTTNANPLQCRATLFKELRERGFIPAPKLMTSGIWSLTPNKWGRLSDPDKATLELILLGDYYTLGPPNPGVQLPHHPLTTVAALHQVLVQAGYPTARFDEKPAQLHPDSFTIVETKTSRRRPAAAV